MRAALRRLSRLLKLGALIGALVGLRRALRGRRSGEVTGQATWPPLTEATPPTPRRGPVQFHEPAPEPAAEPGAAWVAPVDGVCPSSHPIKANASSKIFHVPGGQSYDRTIPERCYAEPDAAEADGFRRAKR